MLQVSDRAAQCESLRERPRLTLGDNAQIHRRDGHTQRQQRRKITRTSTSMFRDATPIEAAAACGAEKFRNRESNLLKSLAGCPIVLQVKVIQLLGFEASAEEHFIFSQSESP